MCLSPKLDPYLGGPCCSMLDCLCFRDCQLLQRNKYYGKIYIFISKCSEIFGPCPAFQELVPQSGNAFNALLAACEKAKGASVDGRSIAGCIQIHGRCQELTFCRFECNLDGGVWGCQIWIESVSMVEVCWSAVWKRHFQKQPLQIKASAKRFRAIGWRYHMADIEFYTKGLQGFKTKHSQTIPWEYPNKRYCHQLGIAEICHQTRRKMMMNPQGPIVGRKLCKTLVFTSKQLANGCLYNIV